MTQTDYEYSRDDLTAEEEDAERDREVSAAAAVLGSRGGQSNSPLLKETRMATILAYNRGRPRLPCTCGRETPHHFTCPVYRRDRTRQSRERREKAGE